MRVTKFAVPAVVSLVVALVAAPVAAAADEDLPVARSFAPGVAQQLSAPDSPPPGANDWSCEPSDEHPNPVVLVHGLLANQTVNWQTFAPLLRNEGYCVFSLTYGIKDGVGVPQYEPGGLRRMQDSAEELSSFVDEVRAATGASEVDLLGHSQGTIMPSYYVRFLDGADKVDKYVSLTPLWDGTTLYGLSALHQFGTMLGIDVDDILRNVCESCTQFLQGSDYYKELNAVGMFDPDVTYTNIVTKYDQTVVPYTSGIAPEADNITNIVLQDECPQDYSDHAAVAYSPAATGHVRNALDPDNAEAAPCEFTTPLGAP